MRFFLVYPNQIALGHKPIGISMLSAMLKSKGHDFYLFDLSQFRVRDYAVSINDEVGEETLEFKKVSNPQRLPKRKDIDRRALFKYILSRINEFSPDLIGFSVISDNYKIAEDIARVIKCNFNTPLIIGGIHATVESEELINSGLWDIVCIGEGEDVIAELADKISINEPIDSIKNLWIRKGSTIIRNDVRPLIQDLDRLPFPDWSIFTDVQFYKPYFGYVYRYGDFELSRGCPYRCSYCVNESLQKMYKDKGKYHREKSVSRCIAEIKSLVNTYNIEFIKFWDETFLLMSQARLDEFSRLYREEVNIPFTIETTAESIKEQTAKKLREMNCVSVTVGLETGNEFLRTNTLNKKTSNQSFRNAFRLLRDNGLRSGAFIMLGIPGETRMSVQESINFVRGIRADNASVGIFYPYRGIPLYEQCKAKGLFTDEYLNDGENFQIMTRSIVPLKLNIPKRLLLHYYENFNLYVTLPRYLHPFIRLSGFNNGISKRLSKRLKKAAYKKKFGVDNKEYEDLSCHSSAHEFVKASGESVAGDSR